MAHIIIPPKTPPPVKNPAAEAAAPTELEQALADDGSPITEAGTRKIKVPKGTKVTIGGREYVAQSDEGITIRGFTHNQHGQPTSVVIIDAPTKEAAQYANYLVASGQMLSEDEVLWRRARKLPIDPALTYDRKTGKLVGNDPRKRRDHRTDEELMEDWLAYLAATDPRTAHTAEALEEKKTKLLAERAESTEPARVTVADDVEETVELTTRGKIK
jgi:hypothetical protein